MELTTFGTLSSELADAVSSAEMGTRPVVSGMGIYMEFPNGNSNTQMLITPEGKNAKGEVVPMAFTYRTIADHSPRKQWRVSFIRPNSETMLMSGEDKALDMAGKVEDIIKRQMKWGQLATLRSRPIVFELTDLDFADVQAWKVPASALRRIQKARITLGFPEKLI
jgi:hypothetical protein